MSCPRCSGPLARLRAGAFQVGACWKCAGVFAPSDASKHVGEKLDLEMLGAIGRTDAGVGDLSGMPDGTDALACPMCGDSMKRLDAAGTTLDVCAAHGTWFDAHELEKVMRAREAERQNEGQTETEDDSSASQRARANLYAQSAPLAVTESTAQMATEVIADVAVEAVASGAVELAAEGVFAIITAIFD
jgi:Zn-finger nucleic acid-binding protein